MMSIKILLVDDHVMMRAGLRAMLAEEPDTEVVGEAAGGRAALDLVRTLSPDVVVMDIGMPDLNGIEATRRIRAEYPKVKVVALTTHAGKGYVDDMLEAGASAYVPKVSALNELLLAVRAASSGQTYLSPEIAGAVVARAIEPQATAYESSPSQLGSREREVLKLVAEGMSSAEIAIEMHLSIKTIETHRRNLKNKLGLHGTAELTKYAVREGLTSIDR